MSQSVMQLTRFLATITLCTAAVIYQNPNPGMESFEIREKTVGHIHSIMNAYQDIGGQYVVETDALINTKFRTWKRNADLINALLALPKGLNEAGR